MMGKYGKNTEIHAFFYHKKEKYHIKQIYKIIPVRADFA